MPERRVGFAVGFAGRVGARFAKRPKDAWVSQWGSGLGRGLLFGLGPRLPNVAKARGFHSGFREGFVFRVGASIAKYPKGVWVSRWVSFFWLGGGMGFAWVAWGLQGAAAVCGVRQFSRLELHRRRTSSIVMARSGLDPHGAKSATQLYTYEVFLWRTPLMITTNNWEYRCGAGDSK